MDCAKKLDIVSEFKKCLEEFTQKYSYIEDTSSMQLGTYQEYNLTIEELTCGETSAQVTVKLNDGTNDLRLHFIREDGEEDHYSLGNENDQDAPNVGETRTYTVNYPQSVIQQNITKIEVKIMMDTKLTSMGDSKSC